MRPPRWIGEKAYTCNLLFRSFRAMDLEAIANGEEPTPPAFTDLVRPKREDYSGHPRTQPGPQQPPRGNQHDPSRGPVRNLVRDQIW